MKHFGKGKVFFSILWLSVFSFLLGCETIPIREAIQNDDTEPEVSVQSTFKKEDLCSLLSKQEVGALLKKKMEDPEFFINQCTYKVVQPSPLSEFSIEISFDDGSGFNYNKKSGKEQGRKIRDVKGIGDAAYFDGGHLNVIKGHVWLIFWTGSSGKHPEEKVMKALAKKAVDRLPAQ
ncbi:MAG: hypothetical protein WAV13_03435 [Thermodesulfovibrionales bacterium]